MNSEKIEEEIHNMLKEISVENKIVIYAFTKGIYARERETKTLAQNRKL